MPVKHAPPPRSSSTPGLGHQHAATVKDAGHCSWLLDCFGLVMCGFPWQASHKQKCNDRMALAPHGNTLLYSIAVQHERLSTALPRTYSAICLDTCSTPNYAALSALMSYPQAPRCVVSVMLALTQSVVLPQHN